MVIMVLATAFASVWRTAPYNAQTAKRQAALKALTALKVQTAPICATPKYHVLMASAQQAPVAFAPQTASESAPLVTAISNVVMLDLPPTIVRVTTIIRQQDNEAPVQLAFNFAA